MPIQNRESSRIKYSIHCMPPSYSNSNNKHTFTHKCNGDLDMSASNYTFTILHRK